MTTRPATLGAWPLGAAAVLVSASSSAPVTVGQPGPQRAEVTGTPELLSQLARLGLRLGMTVTPLMRTPGRGLVLAVGDLRLAVDRASADALHVQAPGHLGPTPIASPADGTVQGEA